ncbi:MAG TPA: peptidylprolyl isomerase [Pyrinomonadaceae bacterium]|jgi:cyclophilin family peptidyl-prolyl cis-trans isomerase/HEAT repeat protein
MRKKEKPENYWSGAALLPAQAIRLAACVSLVVALFSPAAHAQQPQQRGAQSASSAQQKRSQPAPATRGGISQDVALRIMRAEDERRWDNELASLLSDKSAVVRSRAALAAGRIGDERAVTLLVTMLRVDADQSVRAMSAFALGETESVKGAEGLMAELKVSASSEVRARCLEALGKIAAALPKTEEARSRAIGEAILAALKAEAERKPQPDNKTVLLGLTAALRARPANAGPVVAGFLSDKDARVRSDALNTMARLKAKDGLDVVRSLLTGDADAVVRANAARVVGAAEDKASFDALVSRLQDGDERVRVSAIRALASLKDERVTKPLLERAGKLTNEYRSGRAKASDARPPELNELLEIATALGRTLGNTWNKEAVDWLRELRELEEGVDPEIETAFAHIAPALYVREKPFDRITDEAVRAQLLKDWRRASGIAQALAEIAALKTESDGNAVISIKADAVAILRAMLEDKNLPVLAAPDVLRALAAFKPNDLAELLRQQLKAKDVVMRATAAELLGELPPEELTARALAEALPESLRDELNDAALAILDALGKQKSESATEALKAGLGSLDYLVRRRAAAVLKATGAGDFDSRIGTVQARNTLADYQRVLERTNKRVRAVVTTDKGSFTMEFLTEDAPLTVDNFVQLARRGYFNNISFHRVVPNFVVQGGDPRGDGNGGPGYQIRCEINEVPYVTGAVGMALSGKDTGGSQWFVTHSPQPHLDGGYTVFARVVEGMDVVYKIARGDKIRNITVTETARPASKVGNQPAPRAGVAKETERGKKKR